MKAPPVSRLSFGTKHFSHTHTRAHTLIYVYVYEKHLRVLLSVWTETCERTWTSELTEHTPALKVAEMHWQ